MQKKTQKEFYDVPTEAVSEGVIMEGVLSHYVSPKTAISYAENMHNDTIGMMTSRRPMVSRVTPSVSPLSCVQFSSTSGQPYICWQEGSTFKATPSPVSGTVTTTNSILDANYRARYDVYGGALLITPDTAGVGQPLYTYNGTTAPVALTTSFTARKDLISAGFDQRIWMADSVDNVCRVYYTDPIALSGGAQTATGGTGFIVIPAEGGDMITGLIKTQRCLYVFTHNNIFQVFNTAYLDNAPIAYVGAYSQEGIVKAKNGFYFYNPTGVFFLQPGGQPQEISVKIRDILKKVPTQYQSKVFGWSDEDHVTFCLGNKLQGYQPDKTYYVRYTISTQVWTIYSTLGFIPTCADSKMFAQLYTPYDYQGTERIFPTVYLFGNGVDTSGNATGAYYGGTFNVFEPTTENSAVVKDWGVYDIPMEYQTNWLTFDLENHDKRANGLYVPSVNGAGLKVAYQTDQDLPNVWREVGVLSSNYVTAFNSWQSNEFNRIKFRIYGNNTTGAVVQVGVPRIKVLDDLGFKTN